MRLFKLYILIFMLPLLASCGPVYKTDYRYTTPPTETGKFCANNCLDKLDSCNSTCQTRESECRRIKSLEAENRYLHYVNKQQKDKKPVEKDKGDFENYSSCKTTCEARCEQSHRICHVNCGGDVIETRHCTAFCD